MKTLTVTAFAGMVAALVATAAQAQPGPGVGPVCIRPFDTPDQTINHTHVVDPRTIIFYMRDGTAWKNTLKTACPQLMFHGFTFATDQDEVCANSQSIKVINSGEVCELGNFTRYTPPPGSTAP